MTSNPSHREQLLTYICSTLWFDLFQKDLRVTFNITDNSVLRALRTQKQRSSWNLARYWPLQGLLWLAERFKWVVEEYTILSWGVPFTPCPDTSWWQNHFSSLLSSSFPWSFPIYTIYTNSWVSGCENWCVRAQVPDSTENLLLTHLHR
jgi:hypothetical protein